MIEGQELRRVIAAWSHAGAILQFRIHAPFCFFDGSDHREVLALLPDFGGPNGMLIAPTVAPAYQVDAALFKAATAAGFYCSFIDIERYSTFDEAIFLDALRDWGYQPSPSTWRYADK